MKVIQNNLDFPRKVTCKRIFTIDGRSYGTDKDFCNSVLEIDIADIRKHYWGYTCGFRHEEGVDYGVVCPICGAFILIEHLPKGVREHAPLLAKITKITK